MKFYTVKILLLVSIVMMLLLIIGHVLSYVGINIDHSRILMAPIIVIFPAILLSVIIKPGNFFMNLKKVSLWLKLSIIPLTIYLIILIHYSVEYDKGFTGVADVINGEYVMHSHGVIHKKINREFYDEIRSYNHRLSTVGIFLFYYIILLCMFVEYRKNNYD